MKQGWYYALIFLLLSGFPAQAGDREDIYQKPEDFVYEAFSGNPPDASMFTVTNELRPDINAIMEHSYSLSNVTYWGRGARRVWILEEIGKYKPITAGIVIENNVIEQVKVLIYRESHGWQVKRNYFTDQFKGATLTDKQELSQDIDNISGATMSVDALRNLGKLALYLNQHANRTQ